MGKKPKKLEDIGRYIRDLAYKYPVDDPPIDVVEKACRDIDSVPEVLLLVLRQIRGEHAYRA